MLNACRQVHTDKLSRKLEVLRTAASNGELPIRLSEMKKGKPNMFNMMRPVISYDLYELGDLQIHLRLSGWMLTCGFSGTYISKSMT